MDRPESKQPGTDFAKFGKLQIANVVASGASATKQSPNTQEIFEYFCHEIASSGSFDDAQDSLLAMTSNSIVI